MHLSAHCSARLQCAATQPAGKACTRTPEPHAWGLLPQSRRAPGVAPSAAQQEPPEDSSQMQDRLVNMLRLEIGKKEVETHVEESGERLKQVADEAKEEMERLAELSRLRSEVAFDSALADINREADEFEEQLRQSREAATAAQQAFDSWEAGMAVNRSQGQFFQSLYQKDKGRPVGESAEQLQERAAKVVEPAQAEVGSRLRVNLFFALAFLLAAQVGADLAGSEPSVGPDALYTALAALAVWLAVNERRSLP